MKINPMQMASSFLLGLFLVGASPIFGQGMSEHSLESGGALPRKFVDFTIQTPDHQSGVVTLYIRTGGFDGG